MSIFLPTAKSLREEYELLNEYEEFKNLSDNEMRLGFYYACKSSKYINFEASKRIIEILKHQKDLTFSDRERDNFTRLHFSDELISSFTIWGSFLPDIRMRGKNIMDSVLKNCETVALIDITKYLDIDVGDSKSFMDMQINIVKNIPEIIRVAEQGFGVQKKKDKKEDSKTTDLESALN